MTDAAEHAREAERQQLLLRVLWRQTSPDALAPWLRNDLGPAQTRGLQAHQAHARVLAPRALAAAYPTLQQLLGDASFAALARAHWHHAPPAWGDVGQWGADLADFVASAPDLADEPYLADLARLEWAVHRAATAADETAAPVALRDLAQHDLAALRLWPQAGTALVLSMHPIVSIWQAHHVSSSMQHDRYAAAREALAQQRAEPALVWRSGWRVQVVALAAAEAAFTRAVLQGQAVGVALQAPAAWPDFDFQAWLLLQLTRGWLAGAGPVVGSGPKTQS